MYLGTLRRHIGLIAFVVVAMTAAAYIVTSREAPKYQASAQVLVNRTPAVALPVVAPNQATDSLTLQRDVSDQLALAKLPQIAATALRSVKAPGLTPAELVSQVSLSSPPDTDLVTVTVTASSPQLAQRLSTAYAHAFSSYDQRLITNGLAQQEADLTQAMASQLRSNPGLATTIANHGKPPAQSVYAQLVQARADVVAAAAEVPANSTVVSSATSAVQTAPEPSRNALLAFALALLLGGGLAYAIDALGKRAYTTHEVSEKLGPTLLARVPAPRRPPGRARWSARGAKSTLSMLTDPASPHAEAIKMLQANLELARLDHASTVVLCTSAVSGEGKSTTTLNLALSLAQAGRDVVLVDADLRRPVLARLFGVESSPGLAELALGESASLREVSAESLRASPIVRGRLRLMPAGSAVEQPDRLLSSPELEKVFARFRAAADFVLIDSPPLTEVYDSLIVSRHADVLLAVARVGHVKLPALSEFARLLATTSVPTLGYVVTGVKGEEAYRYETSRVPNVRESGGEATSDRTAVSP